MSVRETSVSYAAPIVRRREHIFPHVFFNVTHAGFRPLSEEFILFVFWDRKTSKRLRVPKMAKNGTFCLNHTGTNVFTSVSLPTRWQEEQAVLDGYAEFEGLNLVWASQKSQSLCGRRTAIFPTHHTTPVAAHSTSLHLRCLRSN